MRVLHLSSGNLYGGVETLLVTLARERALCPEMEPEFGFCFDGPVANKLREAGAAVHLLGEVRFSRPWTVWAARRSLRRLIAARKPDVVVTHACWPHALFAPPVRRERVPLVFWAHDVARSSHWVDRRAARVPPDRVIANSKYTASSLGELFPNIPTEVLYLPVRALSGDRSRRAALRRQFETPDDAVVILMASRLEEWKGHPLLLEALGHLKGDPRWTCWIAGGAQRPAEEAYLARMKELAAKSEVSDRLRWLGHRNDVPDVMAAADIYCQPNLGPEPFGVVMVEALYAGLPVVATGHGGALEVVDSSCGICVPPGQGGALASALKMLVDSKQMRASLGAAGLARAEALSGPGLQMQRLEGCLELLAGQAGEWALQR